MSRKAVEIVDGKLPCSRCKQILPVEDFYSGRKKSNRMCGYSSSCKACQRQYFVDHPDKAAAQRKQSLAWQKAHPKRFRLTQRISENARRKAAAQLKRAIRERITDRLIAMQDRGEFE